MNQCFIETNEIHLWTTGLFVIRQICCRMHEIQLGYMHLGSVWIEFILLKLKTYCWNHCSKIIFKCVNSIVGPIFNEKVVKKWNLWVHKQYTMHCLRQKSQPLLLLFIEQYRNSNRVLPKRMKKKKKKKKKEKRKTQTGETQYPN